MGGYAEAFAEASYLMAPHGTSTVETLNPAFPSCSMYLTKHTLLLETNTSEALQFFLKLV